MINSEDYFSVSREELRFSVEALSRYGIGLQQDLNLEFPSMTIDEKVIEDFLIADKVDAVLSVNENNLRIHSMRLVQSKGP